MSVKKYDIHPKCDDHAKWYQTVLTVSDMIDYSEIGGCYVLKPRAFQIWETIRSHLDNSIKNIGIENYYFPMFVTKSNLEKESSHFSDFTPEVAWLATDDSLVSELKKEDWEIDDLVNKLKSKGLDVHIRTEISERYAIRPTSETIIYPHFATWIKKDGIYPKINQWANVVRWETKTTQPFIRSREFLWQEGHTCHPSKDSALKEVYDILDIYKNIYEKLLAVPVIAGVKTPSETFPGAELTTTIEGYLPDSGKGIQAATSHYLGEKFSRIFSIKNPSYPVSSCDEFVKQNSWGLTTRSIGVMVMTHSDDRGLVLPPNISPTQVVMVACGLTTKTSDEEKKVVNDTLSKLCNNLNENGIRTVFDNDIGETPGMKFNKWECRGVPLRIEFGPKDLLKKKMLLVRRDKPLKSKDSRELIDMSKIDHTFISAYLENIQKDMFDNALNNLYRSIIYCSDTEAIVKTVQNKKLVLFDISDFIDRMGDNDAMGEFGDDAMGKFEDELKKLCKIHEVNSTKILCIPNHDEIDRMIKFNIIPQSIIKKNNKYALFGRSY
jgi:prolyl-tRNA synthetase